MIHLGDGAGDVDDLAACEPQLLVRSVSGNCDWAALRPSSELITMGEAKIFICHGHNFGVRGSLDRLALEARRQGASTALFGHTHRQFCGVIGGVQCINPGSLCEPRDGKAGFALLDISGGQVSCRLMRL